MLQKLYLFPQECGQLSWFLQGSGDLGLLVLKPGNVGYVLLRGLHWCLVAKLFRLLGLTHPSISGIY